MQENRKFFIPLQRKVYQNKKVTNDCKRFEWQCAEGHCHHRYDDRPSGLGGHRDLRAGRDARTNRTSLHWAPDGSDDDILRGRGLLPHPQFPPLPAPLAHAGCGEPFRLLLFQYVGLQPAGQSALQRHEHCMATDVGTDTAEGVGHGAPAPMAKGCRNTVGLCAHLHLRLELCRPAGYPHDRA